MYSRIIYNQKEIMLFLFYVSERVFSFVLVCLFVFNSALFFKLKKPPVQIMAVWIMKDTSSWIMKELFTNTILTP